MPITQARMISLIGAALDYKQALDQLVELVQSARQSPDPGLRLLSFAPGAHAEFLLKSALQTQLVIALESTHFRRESRRNAKKAANLREDREAERWGLTKPQRGDGGSHGGKGKARARLPGLPLEPTVPADLELERFQQDTGTIGLDDSWTNRKKNNAVQAGRTGKGPAVQNVSQFMDQPDPDPSSDEDLDFGPEEPQAPPQPEPEYIPGELSEATKAEIEKEVQQRNEQREFEEQFGHLIKPTNSK